MVLSNNIDAVANTDLWSMCGKDLKNIVTGQYFYIDKDHNYLPGVQTAISKDVLIFNYKYAPNYTILYIKSKICGYNIHICALTGFNYESDLQPDLFLAPLSEKTDPELVYQEFSVIVQD